MVADFFQIKPDLDEDEDRRMRLWLDGWALPHLAHIDVFRDDLESAGFADVAVDDITANVMRSSRRIYKASRIILPMSKPLELVGLRSKRQTANVVASHHQYTTIRETLGVCGRVPVSTS